MEPCLIHKTVFYMFWYQSLPTKKYPPVNRVTAKQVKRIKADIARGCFNLKEMAERNGVSPTTIRHYKHSSYSAKPGGVVANPSGEAG